MNKMTKTFLNDSEVGDIPEEWEIARLGDVADDFVGGGTPSTTNPDYWNGKIAWMTSSHINGRIVNSGQRLITEKGLKESSTHLIPKDNLLVATRVGIGKAAINSIDVAISQDLTGVIIKKDKANADYIYWFLLTNLHKLKSLAQGSTIKGILKDDLANLKIPLPPLPEQRRIAEVLGTVDSAIQKVGGAIEGTERLKKGLMQRLLTKGVGHERFKFSKELDCEIPEEWEIIKVGELCQGIVPGRNKPKKFDGEIPWITQPDIDTMYIASSKSGLKVSKAEVKKSGGKIIPSNSVIMSCVGKFGIIAITRNDIVMNQQLHAFVCPDILDPYFLAVFLKSRTEYMISIAATTTVPYLNKDKCNSIPIILPPLPEQRRIAEILSAVDRKLELERRRKEKLERVKKGLMNELLTGRKRVKV